MTNQRLLCPHNVWQNSTVHIPPRLGMLDRLVMEVPSMHCPASTTKRSYNNNPEADEYRKIAAPSRLIVFWMASQVIEVELYRLMAHAEVSCNADSAANIPIANSGNRANFFAFRIPGTSAPFARVVRFWGNLGAMQFDVGNFSIARRSRKPRRENICVRNHLKDKGQMGQRRRCKTFHADPMIKV
jgi:hypothetical protein